MRAFYASLVPPLYLRHGVFYIKTRGLGRTAIRSFPEARN